VVRSRNALAWQTAVIGVRDDKRDERSLALVVKRQSDANRLSEIVIKNHLM